MLPNREPSTPEFLRALSVGWLTAMSGAASVPFTLLAIYVSDVPIKALWGVLALLCLWAAAFQVWKRERIARNLVEDRLAALEKTVSAAAAAQASINRLASLHITGLKIKDREPRFAAGVAGTQYDAEFNAFIDGLVDDYQAWADEIYGILTPHESALFVDVGVQPSLGDTNEQKRWQKIRWLVGKQLEILARIRQERHRGL
jgi:hypothetical protein